jgi:HAE1 family hydrophobic/amphiphilic exporter-1
MFKTFIDRPVLSLVISLFFVLLGLLGAISLPITQFPDIVPPSVVITAKYTGANAEVCAKAVATPLERAVNGVPGMTSINTVCTNNGLTLITIAFAVGTDPDLAAVNVQNRVVTVLDELPEEVIKNGVTTEKEVNSMLMYLNVMSRDEGVDEKFVYNFADITLLRELKRIDGVGYAEIMGARDYAMRVWLKPDRMTIYEVSTDEIIESIRAFNVEAAPGKTGEGSGKKQEDLQYILLYGGKFNKVEDYAKIPIRAGSDGTILRLGDVAEIEFGSQDYHMISKTDGRPSASIMIKQRPGSNASEVIKRIKERLVELEETDFPSGMYYSFNYDVSRFLDASIKEVVVTLIEAFFLVFVVVFLFLQDWRATLIPALAVPVALVGTFAFMSMLGFSINLLTLFALVLAIGIVVDNAIVVVEAVHKKMEEMHVSAREATLLSMKEIGGAIVAITLVMSAVFVPVAFLGGPVGIFYRQFSVTLAISIVISGINALTLTPALCAIIMKPHGTQRGWLYKRFFPAFNKKYDAFAKGYMKIISPIAGRSGITLALLTLFFVLTYGTQVVLPGGFIPQEDQGVLYISVSTPPGSTVERTSDALDDIYEAIADHPAIESVSTLAGYSILTEAAGASYGMGMVSLKPWALREQHLKEVQRDLEERTAGIYDARLTFFPPPTVPGFGNASGFEFRLVDRNTDSELLHLDATLRSFLDTLRNQEGVGMVESGFSVEFPRYLIEVDMDVAAKKGVSIRNAMDGLQTFFGSYYASNFIRFGMMYKVMVQSHPDFRRNPDDLKRLYVKNQRGQMVPYETFVKLVRTFGPDQITRFNMFNAAMVNGDVMPGYSSGEGISAIQSAAASLPKGFSVEWSGMTREEVLAGNGALWIFMLCIVFVYLLLSAQYESFALPLVVILSLPAGIFGSFLLLWLMGLENNIYAQVALVMLVGLLGKNAILVVEIARQRVSEGHSALSAAISGASERFRPIMMTSIAFTAGLIPLFIAEGAGEMGSKSIGAAAAGGMITGTLLGFIIVPGLFVLFSFQKKKPKKS